MIDEDSSQTPVKSLCSPFLSFFAQSHDLAGHRSFLHRNSVSLTYKCLRLLLYLATASYDIFDPFERALRDFYRCVIDSPRNSEGYRKLAVGTQTSHQTLA